MAHRGNESEAPSTKGHNYTMIQFFEWDSEGGGKHWNHYKEEVPRLAKMGITAVWVPPPTKSSSPDGVGYGIYDLWDLGEFDQKGETRTKWGTKDELQAAIKAAKAEGIVTYFDAVLNHKDGADEAETFKVTEVDEADRNKTISDGLFDIEGWTKFTFPGRGDKYSKLKWNFNHFTGVDYDNKTSKKGIFKIQGDGKGWAKGVDKENANYDYLMMADLDHRHPEVRDDLIAWGEWCVKEFGIAGFRFDAIKHIDEDFIFEFVKNVRKRTGKELFGVGEFWKDSVKDCIAYLDRFGAQFSIFDAPLHYNLKEASDAGNNYDLTKIFDGTIVQVRPIDCVTIVNNHDTTPGQGLESWVGTAFMPLAYAFILLRPDGYPCVFYGDLYGLKGDNPQEPMAQLSSFILARKLLAYGEMRDYMDHPNCVGWVRPGDKEHDGCAVVVCNGTEEGTKHMEIGKEHAGEIWTDVLGWSQGEVKINDDGWADFRAPAASVSIWAKKDAKGRDEFGSV